MSVTFIFNLQATCIPDMQMRRSREQSQTAINLSFSPQSLVFFIFLCIMPASPISQVCQSQQAVHLIVHSSAHFKDPERHSETQNQSIQFSLWLYSQLFMMQDRKTKCHGTFLCNRRKTTRSEHDVQNIYIHVLLVNKRRHHQSIKIEKSHRNQF